MKQKSMVGDLINFRGLVTAIGGVVWLGGKFSLFAGRLSAQSS